MNLKIALALLVVPLAAACTHGSVSQVPMEIAGLGTVYRYEGRANFAHQIADADRMMMEDCKARNAGHPVIVDLQKRDLGIVAMGGNSSTTSVQANVVGNRYGSSLSGTGTTHSSGSVTALRNFNQEILYRCVKDAS